MKKHFNLILVALIAIISIIVILTGKVDMLVKNRDIFYEQAEVLSVKNESLTEDQIVPGIMVGSQDVKLEILTGTFKGDVFDVKNSMSRMYNIRAKKGMKVIVAVFVKDNQVTNVSMYSYKRDTLIFSIIALFFLLLIVIGGMKGLKSIMALLFTGILVVFLMIPMMFRGASPILAAIITAILTTGGTLFLLNGTQKKTIAAMIGTVLGVVVSGLTAFIAGNIAHLSGLTMDDAESMLYIAEKSHFNIKGLMFAAILIASLGAIMDMCMSIASSLFEMNTINPGMKPKDLFRSGMNIGKDMIGTMSNTLILAFVGGSLNLMILIMSAKMPYNQLINLDILGTEIIQGIAGSIGIVLTVPITALVSAYLIGREHK